MQSTPGNQPNKPPKVKAGQFSIIPHSITRNAAVSYGARMLWVILRSYSDANGRRCFPGKTALSQMMGCKERLILKFVRELQGADLLTYVSGKTGGSKGTNSYTLITVEHHTPQVSGGGTREVPQPITKKKSTKPKWDGLGGKYDPFGTMMNPPPEKKIDPP